MNHREAPLDTYRPRRDVLAQPDVLQNPGSGVRQL